ncbi:hypothetical protein D3C80_1710080 [compost metagenome]
MVDVDGRLIKKKIRNKAPNEISQVDREALRVLSALPKWNPGKCNGQPVVSKRILLIRF